MLSRPARPGVDQPARARTAFAAILRERDEMRYISAAWLQARAPAPGRHRRRARSARSARKFSKRPRSSCHDGVGTLTPSSGAARRIPAAFSGGKPNLRTCSRSRWSQAEGFGEVVRADFHRRSADLNAPSGASPARRSSTATASDGSRCFNWIARHSPARLPPRMATSRSSTSVSTAFASRGAMPAGNSPSGRRSPAVRAHAAVHREDSAAAQALHHDVAGDAPARSRSGRKWLGRKLARRGPGCSAPRSAPTRSVPSSCAADITTRALEHEVLAGDAAAGQRADIRRIQRACSGCRRPGSRCPRRCPSRRIRWPSAGTVAGWRGGAGARRSPASRGWRLAASSRRGMSSARCWPSPSIVTTASARSAQRFGEAVAQARALPCAWRGGAG